MNQSADDRIWQLIRQEVEEEARREPLLANFFHGVVLNHKTFENTLSFLLATKLDSTTITTLALRDLIDDALANDREIGAAARADVEAVVTRDPAVHLYSTPLLFLKGFHVLQAYRVAHYFWTHDRRALAMFLQGRISQVLSVDIHPAARIGRGILMDHATGIVIGETAVVGDNVSLLHEVTLGGTGKESGDRHPKVRGGVLIGAGAKLLGNIEIGEGAKIGAGSVVLEDVPAHHTVVGVPARIVGRTIDEQPALGMDHRLGKPELPSLD